MIFTFLQESADPEEPESKQMAEEQAEGGVSGRVWWEYFRAGSTLMGFSFMVFVMLMSQVVCSGSDYFVNIWTQQEYLRSTNQTTMFTTYECLYIYGALIIGVVVVSSDEKKQTLRNFLLNKGVIFLSFKLLLIQILLLHKDMQRND